jgi:hypothetical protein
MPVTFLAVLAASPMAATLRHGFSENGWVGAGFFSFGVRVLSTRGRVVVGPATLSLSGGTPACVAG